MFLMLIKLKLRVLCLFECLRWFGRRATGGLVVSWADEYPTLSSFDWLGTVTSDLEPFWLRLLFHSRLEASRFSSCHTHGMSPSCFRPHIWAIIVALRSVDLLHSFQLLIPLLLEAQFWLIAKYRNFPSRLLLWASLILVSSKDLGWNILEWSSIERFHEWLDQACAFRHCEAL